MASYAWRPRALTRTGAPVSTLTVTEHTTERPRAAGTSETSACRTTLLNCARLAKIRYSAYARVWRPKVRPISVTSILIAFPFRPRPPARMDARSVRGTAHRAAFPEAVTDTPRHRLGVRAR